MYLQYSLGFIFSSETAKLSRHSGMIDRNSQALERAQKESLQ